MLMQSQGPETESVRKYPTVEEIEQDEIRKSLLTKQET